MRLMPGLTTLAILAASTMALAAPAANDFAGATANFTLDHHAQVPGETLKAGDYTIHVVDQLSDRMIVRVDNTASKEHAIFLAVPSARLNEGGAAGPVTWTSELDGHAAMRGFSFPNGSTVEFVYPKLAAVQLAKKNQAKVVAIDPDSQELPALKKMTKDDLQIVHLWTLSLTTIGNEKKPNAVLAQHFQPSTDLPVVASTVAPPRPVTAQTQPVQVASVDPSEGQIWNDTPAARPRRAAMTALPKTASSLPVIALFGLLSLLAAGAVRLYRFTSVA